MAGMRKKSDLPTRRCAVCQRPFTWRKKWEKVWNEVNDYSDRCETHRSKTRPYALKPSSP